MIYKNPPNWKNKISCAYFLHIYSWSNKHSDCSTHLCIEAVSTFWNILWSTVGVEVFTSGVSHDVTRVLALQAVHERLRQCPAHVWVLTICFLITNNTYHNQITNFNGKYAVFSHFTSTYDFILNFHICDDVNYTSRYQIRVFTLDKHWVHLQIINQSRVSLACSALT